VTPKNLEDLIKQVAAERTPDDPIVALAKEMTRQQQTSAELLLRLFSEQRAFAEEKLAAYRELTNRVLTDHLATIAPTAAVRAVNLRAAGGAAAPVAKANGQQVSQDPAAPPAFFGLHDDDEIREPVESSRVIADSGDHRPAAFRPPSPR
jgi:hypothetical protein